MNYNFQGIDLQILELLSLNRFNDSKPFYEEHKEELKQGITVPMRQIVLDLTGQMMDIDDKMYLNPNYTVSRIRRDTRYTKDKMLYRENLWLMLRRNKKIYPFAPFFWFEVSPMGYNYGIAFWVNKQTQFDEMRNLILEKPKQWLDAVKTAENAGFIYNSRDVYKKDKVPNAPKNINTYLNAKNMEFATFDTNINNISSPKLIDELKKSYEALTPIYDFFVEAYDNMISKGLIK